MRTLTVPSPKTVLGTRCSKQQRFRSSAFVTLTLTLSHAGGEQQSRILCLLKDAIKAYERTGVLKSNC